MHVCLRQRDIGACQWQRVNTAESEIDDVPVIVDWHVPRINIRVVAWFFDGLVGGIRRNHDLDPLDCLISHMKRFDDGLVRSIE